MAGAVQPGSELHCYWARVHLDAVQAAAAAGQLSSRQPAAASGRAGRGSGSTSGKGFGGRGGQAAGTQGVAPGITLEAAETACHKAFTAR